MWRPLWDAGPYTIGISMWDLLKGLPDIYWLTCFGKDYVRFFGRKKLLSSPVAATQAIDGSICLQLTQNASDMIEHPMLVEACRSRVIRHLGADAFFDSARPKGVAVRVPEPIRKMLPDWAGMDDDDDIR